MPKPPKTERQFLNFVRDVKTNGQKIITSFEEQNASRASITGALTAAVEDLKFRMGVINKRLNTLETIAAARQDRQGDCPAVPGVSIN